MLGTTHRHKTLNQMINHVREKSSSAHHFFVYFSENRAYDHPCQPEEAIMNRLVPTPDIRLDCFNKASIRSLRAEIDAALATVGEKHGIKITCGSARFTETTCLFKLEAGVIAADGQVDTPAALAFKQFASLFGFKHDDLGRTVRIEGKNYQIIGCRPNAPKRPIILSCGSRTVVASPELVKRALDQDDDRQGEPVDMRFSYNPSLALEE
jgi:hypothetical protein